MNLNESGQPDPEGRRREFLRGAAWLDSRSVALTGDASLRKYFRLTRGLEKSILMDATKNLESLGPFVFVDEHLRRCGFRAPQILARDIANGFLLLEDFGDDTFARLLEAGQDAERIYRLATDFLVALHQHPEAVPAGIRSYHAAKMLEDIELFLEWRTPGISESGRLEFRAVWGEVLPLAHAVPSSLLLRDYHVANLMLLSGAEGIGQVGLLDFQDAYAGPITYDLVSLLEDARRDLPEGLAERMVEHYLAHFPGLDRRQFAISRAILAAQRHTRVLAIFERLSRREGKPEYRALHSPRVERRLQIALRHPILAGVKRWMDRYARTD